MSRIKGDLGFSGNFDPEKAGPFDARMLVQYKSDLINPETWKSLSGASYVYLGMLTVVCEDPVAENNDLYRLTALPYTEEANWVKVGGSGSVNPEEVLATDEEWTTGTSTSKAPNVKQATDAIAAAIAAIPTTTSQLTNNSGFITNEVDGLVFYYTKDETDAKLTAVYRTKGSKANLAEIQAITDAVAGDVWDARDTGRNYVYTVDGEWDDLGPIIDLSLYYNKTEVDTLLETKQDTLVAGDNITIDPDTNTISSSGGGAEVTYTNAEESVITVGGIEIGSTFTDFTFVNLMDGLFYPELNPTLTNPNSTFSENAPPLIEVGAPVTINFTSTFSRGTINPANGTSGFRSGLPTQYRYTGPNLPATVDKTDLSDNQVLADFVISSPSQVSWTSQVAYAAGDQPLTNKGNNFDTPLEAGTTQTRTVSVIAVYPHFATTGTITELTKQNLSNNAYYEVSLAGEDDLDNKQTIEWAVIGDNILSGIEMYNTNSGKWEWLSGSRDASKANFTASEITKTINGNEVQYRKYVNNSAKVGARQLRFYI